jgi:AAA+ ATPase superfamily predicted ATPase
MKLRMVDYCASIFAASPAATTVRRHTEQDFERAKSAIKNIFNSTKEYVMLSNYLTDLDASDQEKSAAQLITHLIIQWIYIRSDRHSYFEIPFYRAALISFDSLFKRLLNVSASEIIIGLEKILDNAQRGFTKAALVLKRAHEGSTSNPDFAKIFDVPDHDRTREIARLVGIEPSALEEALESLFGSRLFNVQLTTGWPTTFINRLPM